GPRDVAKARQWLRQAAEGDHAQAQLALGNLLHRGLGAARDPVAARSWYREAAEANLGSAQSNLANMLARGRGGPQDPVLAYMWYAIAGGGERSESADERKKSLAETMTAKQIMVAETLAQGWIPVRLHWR
ncbi:MAG: tetratricopeptide repeat protein, partial [Candidatus Latescibacteria bacterium]|nr:tetratricopeptide repeat protein [Candidatus Latescibacterota bacterium]